MQIPQEKTNRNYKDSVFVDLFAYDITAKENFISLYNALHGTNLDVKITDVQPVMLEKVLYMKYYNDIAMLIDGKIVILIEHQSTINQNMPFRFLEYIARIYEKITTKDEKFGRKLVKLPIPEFYVFYNGKDDYPTESVMKLSDAFMQLGDNDKLKNQFENANYPLEISVKVININVDKENPILKRCEALKEYAEFIEQVRSNIENEIPEPFTNAIKQAIKKGFLSDYLNRKSTEVQNMLLAEYDYDTDIAVQRREAFDDGVMQGLSQGISQGRNEGISIGLSQGITQGAHQKAVETAKNLLSIGLSQDQIASVTGLSPEEIEKM
ncbi:MAG: Rpn family recombination-promoting nuclease/putative transposase [Spirochaetota bacterium]|nr:Rpn family recombination-promoting nuclease/putative transposase [Spirochaetota bacterium]